jgi:hypothetical protein
VSIRYDFGDFKVAPYRTDDGMLLASATFARDGVLDYKRADGTVRRELRLPETNQDPETLHSFGLAPVGIEHPSGLVTKDNVGDYRKGISLQNIRYAGSGKGGFVRGEVALFDSDAIALAESGEKVQLSAGYTCDVDETPGVWRGQKYDAVQRDVRVNHIALTTRGRAGPEVCLHIDSLDDPDVAFQVVADAADSPDYSDNSPSPQKRRMATFHLDGVEYADIPEVFASAIAPKIKQLEALAPKHDSVKEELTELKDQLGDIEEERDRYQGRSDAYELMVTNAEDILTSLGYRRDGDGGYLRTDAGKGKKKPAPPEDEMEDEEEDAEDGGADEEEEGEEPMFPPKKGKSKTASKKSDSRIDSIPEIDPRVAAKELAAAWREADKLVRSDSDEVFSDQHFDQADTPEDIRRLVVLNLKPELKGRLDSASDAYVQGVYDSLVEAVTGEEGEEFDEDRTDSLRSDSADRLVGAIGAARESSRGRQQDAVSELANLRMQAHKKPLTLSR